MYRSEKRNAFIGVVLAAVMLLMIPAVGIRLLAAKGDVSAADVSRATGEYGKVVTRDGQAIYDNGVVYYPELMEAAIGDLEGGDTALGEYRELLAPSFNSLSGIKGASGGNTVATTLLAPADLQAIAAAFKGKGGAVFAYDYTTGAVLCMLSVDGETSYTGGNRCLTGLYSPGSTMKAVTYIVAVEQDPGFFKDFSASCTGTHVFPGGIRVDCTGYHPQCDGVMALGESCNIAVASVAAALDPVKAGETLTAMGFETDPANRFYYDSDSPFVKSRSSVLYTGDRGYNDLWGLVGQGETLVNLMDMARIAGAVANGGKAAEPYLVEALFNDAGKRVRKGKSGVMAQLFSRKTADIVDELWSEACGTYYKDSWRRLDPRWSYAKTGTAQVGDGVENLLLLGVSKEHHTAFMIVVEDHKDGDPYPNEIANVLAQYLPDQKGDAEE